MELRRAKRETKDDSSMRMITGGLLIVASEQAFAHSQMVPFPNQVFAAEVLYPASIVLLGLGICFLIWGAVSDQNSGEKSA